MNRNQKLTESEWNVMELLWQSPQTLMQLVSRLQQQVGWAKSTVSTVVHRMVEKELVAYEVHGRTKLFRANVTREEVAAREADSLLHRAYQGSVGLLVSAMAQRNDLTPEDIRQLYAIIQEAEEKAK